MTLRDVARKDFVGASRSRSLWTVATLLALLTALVAFGYQGYRLPPDREVKQLFRTYALFLGMLLPIVALVASYMSIAGERESGGVKFLLGFPNTRRDVFLGKLASRTVVVVAGVTFMFVTAATVAAARHATLPLGAVVGLFAVSIVYAAVFVAIAVALSSAVAARSRAIGAAVGAYFGLVVLYVIPGVRVSQIVAVVHQQFLGFDANPDLYNAVTYTSPYIAYRKATNLALPGETEMRVFRRSAEATGDLPAYLSDEFSLVVFAAWLVIPLALGYLRFERADLE